MSAAIAANALTMALVHDRESLVGQLWRGDRDYLRFSASLELCNLAFAAVFFLEMAVKLVGLGTDGIRGDSLLIPAAPLAYFRRSLTRPSLHPNPPVILAYCRRSRAKSRAPRPAPLLPTVRLPLPANPCLPI